MFGLSPIEILLILVVGVFLFGAKRLPDIGKQLGRVGKEFAAGRNEAKNGQSDQTDTESEPSQKQDGFSIEDELKSQLASRIPGLGKLNQVQKAVDTAGKVVKMMDKNSDSKKS